MTNFVTNFMSDNINFDVTFESNKTFDTKIEKIDAVNIKNYNDLNNLPAIEGKVLKGDVTLEEIGVHYLSNSELEMLLK